MGQTGLCKRCKQLARERDELAAQVRVLREVLKKYAYPPGNPNEAGACYIADGGHKARRALTLDPPAALAQLEAQIREQIGRNLISQGFWSDEMSEHVLAIILKADDAN